MSLLTCLMTVALAGADETPCAERPSMPAILSLRERAELEDRWLMLRLDEVVPALMREHGVDMWILVAREYNEDPVLETMLPSSWMAARRRTILVFHADEEGVKRYAVSRYDVGEFFESVWDKEEEPDQWKRLGSLVAELAPRSIAINSSPVFALADGLSSTQHVELLRALPPRFQHAVKPVPELAIGWLETRVDAELEVYPAIVGIAHAILGEGLSGDAVTPGETTTADLEWWFRERISALGLGTWFHPSVTVQRADMTGDDSFAAREEVETIQRGDLVHVDFGITYLGLNTDTQQHAYVLREDEEAPPEGLREALAVGNRLQDLLTGSYATGKSGNDVLAETLAKAEEAGIEATIYTHPLGYHGHGAGATIGLWDQQGGVPGRGDYPVRADTAWSIELMATVPVPEWGDARVRIMLEEDAYFDGEDVAYLDGRQTRLYCIR